MASDLNFRGYAQQNELGQPEALSGSGKWRDCSGWARMLSHEADLGLGHHDRGPHASGNTETLGLVSNMDWVPRRHGP